jgi:phosphatidylserine/phosphatidylglycerophosphate/cardiolipin synthase-like enzyme
MAKVGYEAYTPLTPDAHPVTILADADEYFQDVATVVGAMTEPKLFITSWILKPNTMLTAGKSFTQLVIDAVKKENGVCYILWNTLVSGVSTKNLTDAATQLRKAVEKALPAGKKVDDKLKIVFSTNLDHDLSPLFDIALLGYSVSRIISAPPTDKRTWLERLWLEIFPHQDPLLGSTQTLNALTKKQKQAGDTGELAVASHHQKTVVVSGKLSGTPRIVAWCGGLDFSTGPAGADSVATTHHGKDWWHDYAIRVRGEAAVAVLENFVDRWNDEIDDLGDFQTFGATEDDELDADDFYDDSDEALESDLETELTLPGSTPLTRTTDIRTRYEDMIGDAENWIFIENQYFRHRGLAEALVEQLEDEPNLNVTIVLPEYPEEIKETTLPRLRASYANATTAKRPAIMDKVKAEARRIDPMSKLMVRLQNECLADLIDNSRVRVWIPSAYKGRPYIHSKIMAVDDLAITVGSANTNGRSLDGEMDTEINITFTREPSTDAQPDVKKLRDRFGWKAMSGSGLLNSETSAGYANSYFAKYNLVRYTKAHWEVDHELGLFPIGKTAIVDYLFTYRDAKQLEGSPLKGVTKAQIEAYLDAAPNLWFDIETDDLGGVLLGLMENLL